MKPCGIIMILILFLSSSLSAQYKWNWKDPNDLNVIDLGDNKAILYNGIVIGLIYFLSQKKGSISSTKYASYSLEYCGEYKKQPLSDVVAFKNRIGWKYKKYLWLGYELGGFLVSDEKLIPGIGLSPFFSWNIINNEKIRLSYDNGVGPVYYFDSFPEGGTRFNFYTFYGINLEIKSTRKAFSLGVRNTHISNAFLAGEDRNPSFDGIGVHFDIRW